MGKHSWKITVLGMEIIRGRLMQADETLELHSLLLISGYLNLN